MTASRTITLEILRDGPPHNQLLSPLTVYLAKCQNRPAESIRLGIEHAEFLRWQAGLTYSGLRRRFDVTDAPAIRAEEAAVSSVERKNAIDDASKAVTNLFGVLRSLIAELACEACDWRHIHLIVDASELGALPFELAYAAPGFMVQGERLFLQQNARVTLTRQAHRVATSVVTWPSRPRILCVIADGNLPADAHILALWQAIDPWIGLNDGEKIDEPSSDSDDEARETQSDLNLAEKRVREAEQMLMVLENPTLDEVSRAVGRTCFTHVHILAHGAPMPDAGPSQTLYGLWFRGSNGKRDIVDGDRLEAALRHPRDCEHPTVVTLMTCEGANLSGAILGPGGSVAHAVHTKGVPLVVASQFPLSKGASAVVTEMLYKSLFRGEDPREAIHTIRRELIVSYPDTHDWASLVLYASLPADLEQQLRRVKKASEKLAAESAVERLRVTLTGRRRRHLAQLIIDDRLRKRLEGDVDRLDRAVAAIREWTDARHDTATRIWGRRLPARLCMRIWDAYVLGSPTLSDPASTANSVQEDPWRVRTILTQSLADYLGRPERHDFQTGQRPISMYAPAELLKLAKDSYEAAFFLDTSRVEAWVQVVALCWALGMDQSPSVNFERDLTATRHMAWLMAERVANAPAASREERALTAAVQFEAELLAFLSGKWKSISGDEKETVGNAIDAVFQQFLAAASPIAESYRAHVAWRQLRRYEQWATQRNQLKDAEIVKHYRDRLQDAGVRRYWGPRT